MSSRRRCCPRGRKPLLIASAVLLIALSYPLFLVMQSGAPWAGVVGTGGLGIILAVILGAHAVAAEIFPSRTRQSGLSIAYSVTAAIFAGTVPYILIWGISIAGSIMLPALYLVLVGLATMLTVKETQGIDLLAVVLEQSPTAKPAPSTLAPDEPA